MCASITVAGGYQINEHGARATGMGGAFVARALDGSAIFFNAAGLSSQKGLNVLVGTTLIFPSTTFTPASSTTDISMVSQMFYPSNLYVSYAVDEQLVLGLGVYSPYGLGTEWDKDWDVVGQRLSVKTDLQTFYINPTVAFKINDQLSLGAGVSLVLGSAKIKYRVPTRTPAFAPSTLDGTASLDGTGNGISFNVGAIYKPMEKLSIGAAYRAPVKLDLSGTAEFTDMQGLQTFFPGGDGSVTLPMPSVIQAGVAYDVSPAFTAEADLQFTGWSSYDELAVTLATGPNTPLALGLGGAPLQTSPAPAVKKWEDVFMLRVGGEYKLNDKVSLRAGYIRDMTPQPPSKLEPMLPDANRNDITVGGGYQFNQNLHVDASFMMVLFEDRTTKAGSTMSPSGTYKSSASLVSVNFGYMF
jgi:long-chain fatty acid transport protein